MSTIERFLLVSAIILFIIVFYRWLTRFLRRKDIQGSYPYVFPFDGALGSETVLKVDLPTRTNVAFEILTDEGSLIKKYPEKEYPPGVHAIDMDCSDIEKGSYELKIHFSNQTSRIKIEIDNTKKAPR